MLGTSLSVPSSLYFPGQTNSVLLTSILAIFCAPLGIGTTPCVRVWQLLCCYGRLNIRGCIVLRKARPTIVVEKLICPLRRILNAIDAEVLFLSVFDDIEPEFVSEFGPPIKLLTRKAHTAAIPFTRNRFDLDKSQHGSILPLRLD